MFNKFSMDGNDICNEIIKRASHGYVYSESVAWYESC